MNSCCDLHTHSRYSDGTLSPGQILAQAEALGLCAVALTDHNTIDGLPEFLDSARGRHIRAISGVEISTSYQEKELHILGLFLPSDQLQTLADRLGFYNDRKEESNRNLIRALNQAGYPLDYDQLRRSHPDGTLNRAVIAGAMLEKGYVESVNAAFSGILSKKAGYYVPPERMTALDAIILLRSIGAVPVLAHSFLNLKTAEDLRTFLQQAVPCGLAAMETMYSSYSPELTETARCIAREFGLAESGGSDFHGDTKPHIQLGCGKGSLAVPGEFVDILKKRR